MDSLMDLDHLVIYDEGIISMLAIWIFYL